MPSPRSRRPNRAGSSASKRFDLGGRGLAASGLSVVTAGALLTGVIPGLDLGNAQQVDQLPTFPPFR
ncbi:MAG: hypothetical protein R2710_01300 [Acidimicrobiales bacterium]